MSDIDTRIVNKCATDMNIFSLHCMLFYNLSRLTQSYGFRNLGEITQQ